MVPIEQIFGKKEKPCSTLVLKNPFLHGATKTQVWGTMPFTNLILIYTYP